MPATIRLKRMGRKKQPYYRIVVADESSPRDGPPVEKLGVYNPRTEPAVVRLDAARALYWLHEGATPSHTVRSLFRQTGVWEKFHAGVTAEMIEETVIHLGPAAGEDKTTQRVSAPPKKPKVRTPSPSAGAPAAAAAAAPAAQAAEAVEEVIADEVEEAVVEEAAEADVTEDVAAEAEAEAEVAPGPEAEVATEPEAEVAPEPEAEAEEEVVAEAEAVEEPPAESEAEETEAEAKEEIAAEAADAEAAKEAEEEAAEPEEEEPKE